MNQRLLVLGMASAVLLLAGCGQVNDPVAARGPSIEPVDQKVRQARSIALIVPKADTEFSESVASGVRTAMKTLNHSMSSHIEVEKVTYASATELKKAFADQTVKKPAAIILLTDDTVTANDLATAHDETPLFLVGRDIPKSGRIYYSGTPDNLIGRRLANHVGLEFKSTLTVGLVKGKATNELVAGFEEVIKKSPKIKTKWFNGVESPDSLVKTVKENKDLQKWIVLDQDLIQGESRFKDIDPKFTHFYVVGCNPNQLGLLNSGMISAMILPSYELGYSSAQRAMEYLAYGRRPHDAPLPTPFVDQKGTRSYALMLRRWGYTSVPGTYASFFNREDPGK